MTVTIGTHMHTKPVILHGIKVFNISTKSIPSEAYVLEYAKRTPRNDGELWSFFSYENFFDSVVKRMQD